MPPISSILDWSGKRLARVLIVGNVLMLASLFVGSSKQTMRISFVVNLLVLGVVSTAAAGYFLEKGVMWAAHRRLHRDMKAMMKRAIEGGRWPDDMPFTVLCSIVRSPDGLAGLLCAECLTVSWDAEAVQERGCRNCGRAVGLAEKPQ